MQRWTEEEIKILKDHYKVDISKSLCKIFPNRTLRAIRHKASRLKLTVAKGNFLKEK